MTLQEKKEFVLMALDYYHNDNCPDKCKFPEVHDWVESIGSEWIRVETTVNPYTKFTYFRKSSIDAVVDAGKTIIFVGNERVELPYGNLASILKSLGAS